MKLTYWCKRHRNHYGDSCYEVTHYEIIDSQYQIFIDSCVPMDDVREVFESYPSVNKQMREEVEYLETKYRINGFPYGLFE